MKGFRNLCIALLLGLSSPVLIWVGAGVALYQRRKEVNPMKRALSELACSLNTDCPPGFVCMGGRCVPES